MKKSVIEYKDIENKIIYHDKFQKTKDISHHGITRYEHLLRVAKKTYKVCRFLRLNYEEATRAALMHDLFDSETKNMNAWDRLIKHPRIAAENAKKYFGANEFEISLIKTHMFPITLSPPIYLEGWILDIIDDICAIEEKYVSLRKEIKVAMTFLFIMIINRVK